MRISRRDFVRTTLAGTAGLCVGAYTGHAAESAAPLAEEDGYKLWLRYASPGKAAKSYRKVVQRIYVEGTSATSGVIRDELRSATAALLGGSIPVDEKDFSAGAILV